MEVEGQLRKLLPSKFAICLDGWTKKSTHFMGIFAAFLSDSNEFETVLLAFTLLMKKTSFTAKEYYDLLLRVLHLYNKNLRIYSSYTSGQRGGQQGTCLIGCAS